MVDYDLFLDWAKSHFGEENITFAKGGEEICAPSPFEHDEKHHLWMNPSGGKSKHPENGSYRCWYTNRAGSLVGLVAQLEHIEWDDAEALITTEQSLRSLEMKLDSFFRTESPKPQLTESNVGKIELPNTAYLISKMGSGTYYHRAVEYLNGRKIPIDGLYVTIGGKYDNRILIPYYDAQKNLIWFNARTMSKSKKTIRYMKPETEEEGVELGISQEEVLYMRRWPKFKSKVFVMEGEFDAISLDLCGFYAAACGGKSLSESQTNLLRGHIPVLAFDADKHGKQALIEIGNELIGKGFSEIYYVRPPIAYKDWNKFLQEKDPETVKEYIERYTKRYTAWAESSIRFS